MSVGSNLRDLNWDEIDQSAFHGAGDVVTKVRFWQKPWFLSMLFSICVAGLISGAFLHSKILNIRGGIIYLGGFSREVGTLEGFDSKLQLDLILRERMGIQESEAFVRKADSQIAFKVGSAWTRVRRAALIPVVDSALIRAAKQEADRGVSTLTKRQQRYEQFFGGLLWGTVLLMFGTLFVSVNALKRRATTLVVQSLSSGAAMGAFSDISASSISESVAITRAVNNLPAAIIEFESDGRLLRWNDQMQALTGIPASDVLGRNVIDCVHWGSTSEAAKSTIRRVFLGESIPSLEWTMKHSLGENLELQAYIKPVIDGGGAVRSAAAVIRDVTSEKYGRELLVSTDIARLAIIKALPHSLLRFDSNLNLVEIHDNSQILVEKVNSIRGSKWRNVFGEDLAETFSKVAKQTRLTQKPCLFEYSGEMADRPVRLSFRVTVAGPTDILAVVTDMGDRQQTLEAEIKAEAKFRNLIAGSTETVMMVSAEGTVLYASPAIENIFGIGVESVTGKKWMSLVDVDSHDVAESGWRHALEGSSRFVLDLVRGDELRTAEFVSRNLLEDESVGAVIFNIRDVTERRKLEMELSEQSAELEARKVELRDAASKDALTGTCNYQALLNYLEAICTYSSEGGSFSAILFDIDDFKEVNSMLGFSAADAMLCSLSDSIRAFCREEDILGRLGSEEFLLILPEADAETVKRIQAEVLAQFDYAANGVAGLSICSVTKQNSQVDPSLVLRELNDLLAGMRLEEGDVAA